MEDDTTTGAAPVDDGGQATQMINGIAVDDQGMAIPAPDDTAEQTATAAETTSEQDETETTEGAETAQPEIDKSLQKYAESQGLELDSPNAIKAAKIAMKNQSEVTRNHQRASELEKSMGQMSDESAEQVAQATGENPELLKRLQRVEIKNSLNDFWDSNPDARQYETQMSEIAQTAGLYGSPEAILKAAYAQAKLNDSTNLKTPKETLENLRDKMQAATPRGNAVNGSPVPQEKITPQNVDKLVGQNNLDWFMKNQDAINRAMAG